MSDQAVVIWGEILWDRFPEGSQLGGAPSNVAWHLGLAGGWVQLVSRVGDDAPGREAIERLAQVCDTDLVQLDRERATGEVEVTLERGEPRYRLVPGRAWERIECTPDVATAIGEAGILVFGTLAQHTPHGFAAWQRAIAAAGVRCLKVCDLNLRRTEQPPAGEREAVLAAIDAADVLKINDQELARLADWQGWTDPIGELRRRPRVIALTHGAAGSTLYGERGTVEVAGCPARTGGDNVGCGDAYLALLVHGMTLGWDLQLSARVASRWAAEVAGVRGATPALDDALIEDMLGDAA
jgi:fructokinase